jgi:amidase
MDATAQAELVRSGEASATELVDAAIERIEALNPQLNAVIHDLSDQGRAAAQNSLPDGPFRGVPFLLKDIGAMQADQPFHLGMQAMKDAGFRAPIDSYLGARFREAGFVTIGKTNLPELGILPTTEPRAYGATLNPWDTGKSPGGSSGGAAAAVASGMVPVAHANDGGGSIRIPASACGLVGLKPTRQRISEGPVTGDTMSGLTCEGVLSRSVRDTAAILDAVHGPAPGDPYVAPPPERPYTEELEAKPGQLRIALITTSAASIVPDPIVVEAARDAAGLLESLGHVVEERSLADVVGGGGEDLIETFMTRWEAGQAATLDLLALLLGRTLGPDDVEPLTWALADGGRRRSAGEYLMAVDRHHQVTRLVSGLLGDVDLILTPTLGEPPTPLGTFDDSGADPLAAIRRAFLTAAFTGLYNATGHPAISLPLHWHAEGDGAHDLPIGVQLVGAHGGEGLLIRIAAQLERERPWADRTPPVFATGDT